ncbi:MAG TPA: 1-acyl-sn-glycerol-3-phosphate acyltransferase [Acidimicrobiales bacterium]|nr:1-acyl-sn-glycerol-3-phosphate acyltransferase [Acidimicrobiales bacterium]
MTRPPPYLVRRLVWNPLFLAGTVLLFTTLPLWIVIAAFASRIIPGRWRPLRVAWFLFVYLLFESIVLVTLFVLWVASGLGWRLRSPAFQSVHYRLAGWWLRRVLGSARVTFNLKFRNDDDAPEAPTPATEPLLVFSRHAGPGDSFLLVDAVLNEAGRRPRIVLKDVLQLDPCVDVALNRLPNAFVPSTGRAGEAAIEAIAQLSEGMVGGDAMVLFPEGGNYTERRHSRAIEKLEEMGRPDLAEQARAMRHLLPPKPMGALKAIDSAPRASIAFVGHVGLERLSTLGDLWRGIPMDAEVTTRIWRFSAEEIPPAAEREQWLYDCWTRMDDWIEATLLAEHAVPASGGGRG